MRVLSFSIFPQLWNNLTFNIKFPFGYVCCGHASMLVEGGVHALLKYSS